MTAALSALARLDDGFRRPGDIALADRLDVQLSAVHYRLQQQLDLMAQPRCVVCRTQPVERQYDECDSCTAGHDFNVSRSEDL